MRLVVLLTAAQVRAIFPRWAHANEAQLSAAPETQRWPWFVAVPHRKEAAA
jgi:hypothetical protein